MKTPITLKQYYKSFLSLSGLFASVPPLYASVVSVFLPAGLAVLGFPPLGNVEPLARLGLLLLAASVIHLSYFFVPSRWAIAACVFLSAIALFYYVGVYPKFVVRVDMPGAGMVRVNIGQERTAFALTNFADYSDEEMLRARGTSEEEVRRLWTLDSLRKGRVSLLSSYCVFILGIVSVFSLGVRLDLARQSSSDKHSDSSKCATTAGG